MTEDNKKRQDLLFLILLIFFIGLVALFNYSVDPYNVTKSKIINGFNDNKIHKLTNKRSNIYADIKLNKKNKDKAFVGNCLLSETNDTPNNIAFFSIPVVKMEEVVDIIKNLHITAPNINTIYWGLYFDDFYNEQNNAFGEKFTFSDEKFLTVKDCIDLFFSFNTTKYSIETVKESIKNKDNNDKYIFPYKELANKEYNQDLNFHELDKVKEAVQYAKDNNIKLILYYSPIHITKKEHIYLSGKWESFEKLKIYLAKITPYFDYSLYNEYNSTVLDENNKYYLDSIHLQPSYNNLIISDLISNDKKIGVEVTESNVENLQKTDTENLERFIAKNPQLSEKISNLKKSDREIAIKLNN